MPAQAGMDREARLRNPRGVFGCDVSLEGQRVIVVDDVMTTGATLDELARTLKRQGASWVGNLVVARTPTPY
jgi:predicted amidophosphoribosyltransferase